MKEDNGGSDYTIDLDRAINQSKDIAASLGTMFLDFGFTEAVNAVRQGSQEGRLRRNWERTDHFIDDNMNWSQALGSFHMRYEAIFVFDPITSWLNLKVKFYIRDIYDFDGTPLVGEQLQDLHKAGYARNFGVSGTSKEYEWKYNFDSLQFDQPREFV